MLKELFSGPLAGLAGEHVTCDPGIMSSSPTLGVDFTLKKIIIFFKKLSQDDNAFY